MLSLDKFLEHFTPVLFTFVVCILLGLIEYDFLQESISVVSLNAADFSFCIIETVGPRCLIVGLSSKQW